MKGTKNKTESEVLNPVPDAQYTTASAVVLCKKPGLLRHWRRSNCALYRGATHVSCSITDAVPKWKCSQPGVTGPEIRDVSRTITAGPEQPEGGYTSLMWPPPSHKFEPVGSSMEHGSQEEKAGKSPKKGGTRPCLQDQIWERANM